jgi:hypothetical protein
MDGGVERKADGWNDMEMQTVTFATLQTLFKFKYFVSYKLCII